MTSWIGFDLIMDKLAVGIGEVEAVLFHEGFDIVFEGDVGLFEDVSDLRFADDEGAIFGGVGLVNRAAGGENLYIQGGSPLV